MIQEIATGSSETISSWEVIQRVWKERILGIRLVWNVFTLGHLFIFRKQKSHDIWILLSVIGILFWD